tara:strand:+ start:1459 stop:2169 length:711 start_codon:yes stop_codon:yes gene_type:complete
MAIITTGNPFDPTDAVTSTTLNNIANAATFDDPADETSIEKITSGANLIGKLGIKDEGVTLAKMQHIGTDKVLGRTSASTGDVEEVGIIVGGSGDAGLLFDNDDMLDNSDTAGGSATRGATQQSIKAYVDAGTATQIGVGQTWQDVTRALDGTSYTNSTGKPIMVNGQFYGNTDNHDIDIKITPPGGSEISMKFATSTNSGGGVSSNGSIIIPNNTAYRFTKSGDAILSYSFNELR